MFLLVPRETPLCIKKIMHIRNIARLGVAHKEIGKLYKNKNTQVHNILIISVIIHTHCLIYVLVHNLI